MIIIFAQLLHADKIWSINYLHTQLTTKINMSTLSENVSYTSGSNPAKFHAFYKTCTISLFFASYLSTIIFWIFPKNTFDALFFPVFIRFTEQAIFDNFDDFLPIIHIKSFTQSSKGATVVFCKKGVLKNLAKFTGKCWLRPAILLKKRIQHRCFPMNFAKFSKTPFPENTSGSEYLLSIS